MYRNEIDGIRAVAVLAVAFYHVGISYISGGFVGVDVFFVISGYLITGIIFREIKVSKFTYADFYWRRSRRILPALIFMLISISIISYFVLDPYLFKKLGKGIFSTILFSSNIYFWTQIGYFQGAFEFQPLLHTWSLGIEEQYYIFFPVLMTILYKWKPNKLFLMLSLIGLVSFCLSVWGVENKPSSAFYLLPTRLWELLLGSLVAIIKPSAFKNYFLNQLVQWCGFAMIIAPIILYTPQTNFPGLAALLPCAGTALLIWTINERQSYVKEILSFKPLTFVGKVSYSFYLWHWPVLVLAEYYSLEKLSVSTRSLWLFFAFIISVFSWRIVERPFRENLMLFTQKRVFQLSVVAIFFFAVLGSYLSTSDGFPNRFDQDLSVFNVDRAKFYGLGCSDISFEAHADKELCTFGSPKAEKESFLLWGDSHAMSWSPAFEKIAAENGLRGVLAIWDGCMPLINMQSRFRGQKHDCLSDRQWVHDVLRKKPDIKTVIISGYWSSIYYGTQYGNEEIQKYIMMEYKGKTINTAEDVFNLAFEETIEWLISQGKRVVILGPIPEVGFEVPTALMRATMRQYKGNINPTYQAFLDRHKLVLPIMKRITEKHNVTILYPHKKLCKITNCIIENDGKPLYYDDNHFSSFGALYSSDIVGEALGLDLASAGSK